jgi:hypothetical protein
MGIRCKIEGICDFVYPTLLRMPEKIYRVSGEKKLKTLIALAINFA